MQPSARHQTAIERRLVVSSGSVVGVRNYRLQICPTIKVGPTEKICPSLMVGPTEKNRSALCYASMRSSMET
jgi:hypothetical protein